MSKEDSIDIWSHKAALKERMHCDSCNKVVKVSSGYGLAYGGIGVYYHCTECDKFIKKDQDPDS